MDHEIVIRRRQPKVTLDDLLGRYDPDKHRHGLMLDSDPEGKESIQDAAAALSQELGDNMTVANVGLNIKTARERMGISQSELARRIGVTGAVISNLEGGKAARSTRIPEIAVALNVSVQFLVTGEESFADQVIRLMSQLSPEDQAQVLGFAKGLTLRGLQDLGSRA